MLLEEGVCYDQCQNSVSLCPASFCTPRQTIQYHSNASLCPNHNVEEAEVEWLYENLQDLLELTPKKDVLFIIEDWNAKVGIKRYLE